MPEPHPIGGGRYVVPGNRWDLLSNGPTSAAPAAVDISVVIPYFDNQHDLDLVLTGLSVQTHPPGRLQVVIADDGSPETPTIPEEAADLDVAIVRQDDEGFRAGAARNLGARRAEGSVILFLDGDTVPTRDYVSALGRLPALLPDAVVSGRRRYADFATWTPTQLLAWLADGNIAPPEEWDELSWLEDEYRRTGNLLTTHPRSYKYQIGAVLGCSRDLFDDIGGFDETITGYGGEDYDLTYRAFNAGAVLAYVPEAVAWHDGPDWAGRTEPDRRTAQKNREVMMLAERIPETSMRGHGQTYPVADIAVTVHSDGWSLGAGVLCIRSVLSAVDSSIWIDGDGAETDVLSSSFRLDQRVMARPVDEDDDTYPMSRARLRMWIHRPFRVNSAFNQMLTRMLEKDWGTVTVAVGGETVVEIESTRSRRRRRRWAYPRTVAHFDHRDFEPEDCGIDLIIGEPRMAAVFGGYV